MQKRFERAYVHIGMGKTGTTTIQSALAANSLSLEKQCNLHYPVSFRDPRPFHGNHSYLLRSLFGVNRLEDPVSLAAGIDDEDKLAAANQAIVDDFRAGFDRTGSTRLLLSAEAIAQLEFPSLTTLGEWLDDIAEEVKVVACLRHPLDALSSLIQERVKHGEVLENLYADPPFHKFKPLLQRMAHVFGWENLILYDFSTAVRHDGGVLGQFLDRLGLDLQLEEPPEDMTNVSLSHEAVLLLSALNREEPLMLGGECNDNRVAGDVAAIAEIPGHKFRAPDDVRASLLAQVEPHLAWLREQLGLVLAEPRVPSSFPYREFSPEALSALSLHMSELARRREQSVRIEPDPPVSGAGED